MTAEVPDLDAALELARLCEQVADTDEEYELASMIVPTLVAELRAARKVAETSKAYVDWRPGGPIGQSDAGVELQEALAAYDETLGRRVTIPEGR